MQGGNSIPSFLGGLSADYLVFSGLVVLATMVWLWSQRGSAVVSAGRAINSVKSRSAKAAVSSNCETASGIQSQQPDYERRGLLRWRSVVSRNVSSLVDHIVSQFRAFEAGTGGQSGQTGIRASVRIGALAGGRARPATRVATSSEPAGAVTRAAQATTVSIEAQWEKLTARIRQSIQSAHTAEDCHEAAWRQLDAVDYALLSLRDDLRAVVLEADCLRDEGIEAQLPARMPARAGQRNRAAGAPRRRRDVAGIVRAVESGRHHRARTGAAA